MSAFDGTIRRPGVMELYPPRPVLPFRPSIHRNKRPYCFAKITVDDDEQKHQASRKGFSIRVPTIPNFRDVESARLMLESAFQALTFEMPRILIDSAALQGLTFDIFKLSIPKRVFIFDITGFVATKLKQKPSKYVGDAEAVNEGVYPRCAWPRNPKEARGGDGGVNLMPEEIMAASTLGIPEIEGLKLSERPSAASSAHDVSSSRAPVGPHCAWPRKSHTVNGVVAGGQQSVAELSMRSDASKVSPCIIEGGARCAWPRKTMSAKQSCGAETAKDEGSQRGEDGDDGEIAAADFDDGAAELPRRMLATSVGLTVMNQLVKGSMVTSLFDFCSLMPGGSIEIGDEEGAALELGRRTLLVFIKQAAG